MKLYALPFALAFGTITASALKVPLQQAKRSSSVIQSRSGGAAVSVSHPGAALANVNVLAVSSGSNAFDVKCVEDNCLINGSLLNLYFALVPCMT